MDMSNCCPNYCSNLHSHWLWWRTPSSKSSSTLDHKIFSFFLACVMSKNQVFYFDLYFSVYVKLNIFSLFFFFWSLIIFFWVINTVLVPLPNIVLFVRKKNRQWAEITTVSHTSFGCYYFLLAVYLYLIN